MADFAIIRVFLIISLIDYHGFGSSMVIIEGKEFGGGNRSTVIKEMELDCRRLICNGEKSRCIYRKNWCPLPPCPSMVFCGDERKEKNQQIPNSCDLVRCSKSNRCIMRYVKEKRTGLYTNNYAQCVSELKHQPASCAGFKCPNSNLACILREQKCRVFPCRILRACIPEQEVNKIHIECNRMNCFSPDHCFLRRPYNCTIINGCSHVAGCLHFRGDESLHDVCRGMMCPENRKCEPIYDDCNAADGILKRSCSKARPTCNNYTTKFENQNNFSNLKNPDDF